MTLKSRSEVDSKFMERSEESSEQEMLIKSEIFRYYFLAKKEKHGKSYWSRYVEGACCVLLEWMPHRRMLFALDAVVGGLIQDLWVFATCLFSLLSLLDFCLKNFEESLGFTNLKNSMYMPKTPGSWNTCENYYNQSLQPNHSCPT